MVNPAADVYNQTQTNQATTISRNIPASCHQHHVERIQSV